MCHASPTAELLGCLCAVAGAFFVSYHIYCFDRGRCLLWQGKRHLFRWIMCWIILASIYGFVTWGALQTYVKYKHGYTLLTTAPGVQAVVPVPYYDWPESDQLLVRASYHIASVSWSLFIVVNAEESLYWHYLIRSIRQRHSSLWFKSWQFRLLVGVSVVGFAVLLTLPIVAGSDLLAAEEGIFFAGSVFGFVLASGSFWLLSAFPRFIVECMRRGVNPEVIARLMLFKNLHTIRTALRVIYVVSISCLSVDGLTKSKHLNQTALSLDLLYVTGFITAFGSTMMTVMILLPRNMTTEAGIKPVASVFVRPYRLRTQGVRQAAAPGQIVLSPSSGGSSATLTDKNGAPAFGQEGVEEISEDPYDVLGHCLNMHDPPAHRAADEEIGLETGLSFHDQVVPAQPFAASPGTKMLSKEELERVQRAAAPLEMDAFVSPLFNGEDDNASRSKRTKPMEVIIHTETTRAGI